MQILRRHQISLIDDKEDGSAGSGLMHNKFLVIDKHTVVTGNANITSSGFHGDVRSKQTRGNVNHSLRFRDAALAKLFKAEFQRLWGWTWRRPIQSIWFRQRSPRYLDCSNWRHQGGGSVCSPPQTP